MKTLLFLPVLAAALTGCVANQPKPVASTAVRSGYSGTIKVVGEITKGGKLIVRPRPMELRFNNGMLDSVNTSSQSDIDLGSN